MTIGDGVDLGYIVDQRVIEEPFNEINMHALACSGGDEGAVQVMQSKHLIREPHSLPVCGYTKAPGTLAGKTNCNGGSAFALTFTDYH